MTSMHWYHVDGLMVWTEFAIFTNMLSSVSKNIQEAMTYWFGFDTSALFTQLSNSRWGEKMEVKTNRYVCM